MNNVDRGIVTEPLLNKKIGLNYTTTMTPEEKVNYLVQNLRLTVENFKNLFKWTSSNYIDTKWTPFKKNDYHIEQEYFRGEGRSLTEMLIRLHSEKQGISFEKVDISTLAKVCSEGNTSFKEMLQNNTHTFAIATIEGKRYIIDCAYRQFFQTADNDEKEESLNLEETMSCDKQRKELAKQILKYGWIEATPENIKAYMDGFIEATAGDKDVKLPSEQEYIDNIEGKILNTVEKKLYEYDIKDLWKVYIKEYNPNISEKMLDFMKNHLDIFVKVKNNLVFSEDKFYIIASNGKKYIRTKSEDIEVVSESEDIEFTPENFKKYLDSILMQAGESEDIVIPSVQEYQSLYPCGNPVRKSYKYIIESEPYISDTSDDFTIEMSDEAKITSVVQQERRQLMKHHDLATSNLAGECEDSTLRVLMDSTSKGFENATYLSPGPYLGPLTVGHNCATINLNGKSYLIDCTYRQFFEESGSKNCGIYMINDESRKYVAEQLLKYGWIEATPENIKAYMDGFEMARKNSFKETGISAEEYIERFKGNPVGPHIITTHEIIEATEERKMTIQDTGDVSSLFRELETRTNTLIL